MKEVFPEGRRDQIQVKTAEKPRVNQFGNVGNFESRAGDSKLLLELGSETAWGMRKARWTG